MMYLTQSTVPERRTNYQSVKLLVADLFTSLYLEYSSFLNSITWLNSEVLNTSLLIQLLILFSRTIRQIFTRDFRLLGLALSSFSLNIREDEGRQSISTCRPSSYPSLLRSLPVFEIPGRSGNSQSWRGFCSRGQPKRLCTKF